VSDSFRYASPEDDSPLAVAHTSELGLAVLDEIETLLMGDAPGSAAEALRDARARAAALAATLPGAIEGARLAGVTFAAETLAASWIDRGWTTSDIDRLVETVAGHLEAEPKSVRTSIFVRAIRERHVLDLPPQLGAETVLMMLCTFTDTTSASLWNENADGRLMEMMQIGDQDSSRRRRSAAREAIGKGRRITSPRSQFHSVPVERWGLPSGALVFRCRAEGRLTTLAYASEAAIALAPLIEFDALLGRNASRERSLTAASERRLTRIGFDLHDGPMQDIAAMAGDLRLFRKQLAPLLENSKDAVVALGRIDDLEARLVSVDKELRELARSLQSPAGLRIPLEDSIKHEVDSLQNRSGIAAEVSMNGSFEGLTATQKITLMRIVQESLSNVLDHSEAESVKVRLTATRSRLGLEVVDDGRGFDVEERLLQAARSGRLGLVGMGERIRLLGGRFEIESTPGGPTRVRASLPRWRPLAQEAAEDVAE
jgi:signal transduction histidine kinase